MVIHVNNSVTKHNGDVELPLMDRSNSFQLFEVMSDELDV